MPTLGSKRCRSTLCGDQGGVVYVEFLLVFPPLFLLFLVILQSAILRATDIGVRHAASSSVRSAVVVLPDDPYAYEGQGKNLITMDSSCRDGFFGKFSKLLEKLGVSAFKMPPDGKCSGGPRLEAIRFAAIMRMLPFSPNPQSILPRSIGRVFDGLGKVGWIGGAAAYSYGATAVTFPDKPGSDKMKPNLRWTKEQEPVTVRVSYLAHCGIPIARFFMCDSGYSLAIGKDVDFWKRGFKGSMAARKRIKSQLGTLQAMGPSVGNRMIYTVLIFSGERFTVLSADATLPLNSASYNYQTKDD